MANPIYVSISAEVTIDVPSYTKFADETEAIAFATAIIDANPTAWATITQVLACDCCEHIIATINGTEVEDFDD